MGGGSLAFETKRATSEGFKGGKRQRGNISDKYGRIQPPHTAQVARGCGGIALAGVRAQEQQRINRNDRMIRLARNTGFAEETHAEDPWPALKDVTYPSAQAVVEEETRAGMLATTLSFGFCTIWLVGERNGTRRSFEQDKSISPTSSIRREM